MVGSSQPPFSAKGQSHVLQKPSQCLHHDRVLIVVIILALMAATIIPHITATPLDMKMDHLRLGLDHDAFAVGDVPRAAPGRQPAGHRPRLVHGPDVPKTNQDTTLNPAHGLCGPYVEEVLPTNPFNESDTVAIVNGPSDPTGPTGSSDGWQYNPTTGHFLPNNAEWFQQ